MNKRVVSFFKGVAFAAASMALYVLALWLVITLLLLVVSMEEGATNLTGYAVPLTQAMVLLAQGVGFRAGAVTLSIIPLGLTLLLIWLLSAIARKRSLPVPAYFGGLLVWLVMNAAFTYGVSVSLLDDTIHVLLKTGMVFTAAYLIGTIPASQAWHTVSQFFHERMTPSLRRTWTLGLTLAGTLLAVYMVAAGIDLVVWIVYGYDAVQRVFELDAMGTGSRILTSICTLAWLPNLCMWSLSWMFGAGFHIGDVAHFTLWTDHSDGLPGIPVFAIFPQALTNDGLRTVLISLPLIIAVVCATAFMLSPTGFAIRAPHAQDDRQTLMRKAVGFAYPLGAFSIAGVLVSLASSCMFAVSNGSLGRHRLAHVGVDVVSSTRAVAQPTMTGLFAVWAAVIVFDTAIYGLRLGWMRLRPAKESREPSAQDDGKTMDVQPTPRVVNSAPITKEEQDDNKSAD